MQYKPWLAVLLLAAADGFAPRANAMTIHDFGKMNDDDEATFVAVLVEGAAKFFQTQGQPDRAHQVIAFFKTTGHMGGTYQLADQLKQDFAFNQRNATNPNNRIPERQVEDAMASTLKDEGLPVPASYLFSIGKGFHPDGPPRATFTGQGEFH